MMAAAPMSAHAACPASNQYNFNFSSQTAASLSYASSYTYTATSTALGNQNFNVSFTRNSINNATGIGNLPEISTDVNGGAGNALVMGGIWPSRTTTITSNTRVLVTTLTFPVAVRDVTLTLHDLDFLNNQFRDWMHIIGTGPGGSFVPALTTPFGQANNTGPFINASSSLKLGPQATAPATLAQEAVGVGASGNNSTTGNLNVVFAQPVTSVQLRYGNYPLIGTETATGQQFYALSTVSWCPMPSLTISKTSAPFVTLITDPNRFNIPGADTVYSLTVTNSNSSPVDVGTMVLTDILPTAMTFYNGDIDGAGPLTTNYEFLPGTSGLTFAAANLTYSNNNGATYAYTPSAGYDANVDAIRLNPQGTMAANSSFTIRFRTRIN
jgi:uncharacterized repeat protein (TIGR01451 family)